MRLVYEPANFFSFFVKNLLDFCHALAETNLIHLLFGQLKDFHVVKAEIVLEVIEFSGSINLVESALSWLRLVLQNKVVARLTVVLLEDWILYSLHLSWVSVDAHFFCFIVKEIHVYRVSAN